MFPQMFQPHLNHLVQATAYAAAKGGELQQQRDSKTEKAKQMRFIVTKEQFEEQQKRTDSANNGRFA